MRGAGRTTAEKPQRAVTEWVSKAK
jgi:hypothetical protein